MIDPPIARAFEMLARAYPAWKADAATFQVYALALSDLPVEAVQRACLLHLRRSKFAPTVAELRELAIPPALEGPETAWAALRGQIRSVGSYGTPSVQPGPAQRALEAVGGWRTLCATETAQMGVVAAQFMRVYAACAAKAGQEREYADVAGLLEDAGLLPRLGA